MNSTNPALSVQAFSESVTGNNQPMTLQGAVNKCAILLALLVIPAFFVWQRFIPSSFVGQRLQTDSDIPGSVGQWILVGVIAGFISCLITCFKREWAPVTAPIYAVAEGLALGGISAIYEAQYHGIVAQAVLLTVGTLLAMLALYTMRIIQPTQKFMLGVFAATAGIALTYLIGMVLSFFGIKMGFLYGNGLFGIGFSIVVVIVAALNLIMDFGTIEQGAQNRAPKYMEWYAAFGLLVTLVWLYLEILRLLSKLASRRD